MEGTTENTEKFLQAFLKDPRFADVYIKRSEGNGKAFPKLSVKVKEEIVSTKFPKEVDPRVQTGTYLKPEELKQLYENKEDFVMIDMRNDYEIWSGHFKGSVNPKLNASRDLKEKIEELRIYQNKKVVTCCTGGIRCEKMSAYLLANGFKDVYQLEGGMHGYMEKYPGEDFLGTLYTFDNRKVMDFGGKREIIGTCYFCKSPTEEYVNCKNDFCHLHFLVCGNCKKGETVFCSKECEVKVVEGVEV
jgi:UPF0176 protein